MERRFRGINGWAPLTDYIAIRDGQGFVVRLDGTQHKVEVYTLEYCLFQVSAGNWEEINGRIDIKFAEREPT